MEVTFVGKSACVPGIGEEANCLVINRKYLIDTGLYCALKMREYDFDPLEIETVFFTHIHHDHFIGFPGLLFFIVMQSRWNKVENIKPLTIVGPVEGVQELVDNAWDFLQIKKYPELKFEVNVIPLTPGDKYEDLEIEADTFPLSHPVQSMAYKFKEKKTGKSFATCWDTSFHPPVAEFIKGEKVLIHDAVHSTPEEAAEIAKMAGVKKLYLIHYLSQYGEQVLSRARKVFPGSFLPEEGETIEL